MLPGFFRYTTIHFRFTRSLFSHRVSFCHPDYSMPAAHFFYGVGVGDSVAVGAGVPVPTTTSTYTPSPKKVPFASDRRQVPFNSPVLPVGATMGTENSNCLPGCTDWFSVRAAPAIASPATTLKMKPVSHAQLPLFCTNQVFVKDWPGVTTVLSGMVTSLTKLRP